MQRLALPSARRRPLAPRLSRLLLAVALAAGAGLTGCHKPPPEDARKPVKPDEPRALQYVFEDTVVAAALKGDEAAVRAALKGVVATQADLAAVFGAERAAAVYPAYAEQIVPAFLKEAPPLIIERVKAKATQVSVKLVGPAVPADTVPGDLITLDAMAVKRPMMSLWLKVPGEPLGLRLEGWMYGEGRWFTVLKLHAHLKQAAPEAAEPEGAAPEGAPASGAAPSSAAAPGGEGAPPGEAAP